MTDSPSRPRRRPTLSSNEWVVVGLLVERPRHGDDVAAELQPGTEIHHSLDAVARA